MNRTCRVIRLFGILFALTSLYGNTAWAQISGLFEFAEPLVSLEADCSSTSCNEALFKNVGDEVLKINIVKSPLAQFSVDPATPLPPSFTLMPDEVRRIGFCFSPTDPEGVIRQEIIVEVVTDGDIIRGHDTLTLSGTARSARIQFDPPVINFGDVTAGQESCVPVVIRNTGTQQIDLTLLRNPAFPFNVKDLSQSILNPNEEQQITVCFSPIGQAEYSDTLLLENGSCRTPVPLALKGNGLNFIANIGPVLQVVSANFDTTLCGTEKCRTITLRNVGTDSLEVTESGLIPEPFIGAISPLPLIIPANEERTFTVCYAPKEVPSEDSVEINFRADNRVSLSIAAVFDISKSMTAPFGGAKRIDAANGAGRLFLGNLVNEPERGIVDEGAVYVFGHTAAFARVEGYSTDKILLQNAVPTMATGDSTCLFDAIIRVSAELGQRSIPGRRVMVVLTDGRNDCDSSEATLADAISAAQNAGIRVFTIGIGAFNPSDVREIAQQTGGFYSEALNPAGLLASYQRIISALSENQPATFTLQGRSVAPDLEVSHTLLTFDSIRVGTRQCKVITLLNTGDAPLNLDSFVQPSVHYTVTPATVPEILPGESASIQVCFEPKKLHEIDSLLRFNFRRCVPQSRTVRLEGIGYDSVVISIGGLYYARPGDIVRIPLRLRGLVPASYEIDSLELVFTYNKTLLFPEPAEAPLQGESAVGSTFATQLSEPEYDTKDAHLKVTLREGTLNNARTDTLLAELHLLALHGNAMETPVKLVSARFGDGNPKVGIASNVIYTSDSLCFREELLIDASSRFGPTMKLLSIEGDQVRVSVTLDSEQQIRGDLFDPLGNRIGKVFEGTHAAGELQITFDTSPLPQGTYWLQLVTGNNHQDVIQIPVGHH